MGEVLFYHLSASPLVTALAEILTRSLDRGWRVVVRAGGQGHVAALDTALWTFRDESFLPHGTAETGHGEHQPIYLTTGQENPAGATVLILVEGARVDPAEVPGWERTVLMFDGQDEAALALARADWVAVREGGVTGKYYAQEAGRWVEKASTAG